jgi:hypothetical protein
MAIRKSIEEAFVVAGSREDWLARCEDALIAQGFSGVKSNSTLCQVEGAYHKFLVWGEILVTLFPEGTNTKIVAKATANADNIWALFGSPSKKILTVFKESLH